MKLTAGEGPYCRRAVFQKQRPHSKVFFATTLSYFEEYFCTALSPAQALFQPFNVSGINIQHSARGS